MTQWQFHTPDGVSDLLPEECAEKRRIEQTIRSVFEKRGYFEIETPGLEFFDVYAVGSGAVPQEALFKCIDHQGRILCLRYDGTVPTARVAATLFRDAALPQRFYYVGNMYRYNEFGGGRQRSFSQAGVELIGSSSPEADAEVIATAITTARKTGIEDLQVSIGQVAFFKGILSEWGISGEAARQLPHLIDSKQMVAIEEMADRLQLPKAARAVILKLASSQGSDDDLDMFEQLVRSPVAQQAITNLREVLMILEDYDCRRYVTVDLGMLQSLNYYTGVIFKGFTYNLGFPLFSGGRYDQLLQSFGRDLPATGFSMGISLAMTALQRQGIRSKPQAVPCWICYEKPERSAALKLAEQMREAGSNVICNGLTGDIHSFLARRPDAKVILMQPGGTWQWMQGGDPACNS